MYPDFSYILHDLIGTAPDNWTSIIKTFGLMLAIAILCSSYFLGLELKRKEQEGQLKPIRVTKDGKIVEVWPHEKVGDITLVAAISGIVGAKLFALFESAETIRSFIQNPIESLISGSGLAIYGGLIVAFIVVSRYVKKLGISVLQICDATAPALMVGYGVGRLGCQFSGDGDWGIPAPAVKPDWFILPDWMWSQSYPRNVLNAGEQMQTCVGKYCSQLVPPVFPTPLYESVLALIIVAILWSLRKKLKITGQLFFIYCILNGIERFFIEKIRVNDKIDLMGLSVSQAEIISFLLIFVGLGGFIYLTFIKKQPQSNNSV